MSILILTTGFGNGHLSVAKYLKEYLKDEDIKIINPYYYPNKVMVRPIEYLYNDVACKKPNNYIISNAYGFSYNVCSKYKVGNIAVKSYPKFQLGRIIAREKPSIIFATFPFDLPKKYNNVTLVNVVTDYGFEKVWYSKDADYYFAPSHKLLQSFIDHEVDPKKIIFTGIPCSDSFKKTKKRESIENITLTFGALGYVPFKIVDNILKTLNELPLNVTVICGKNEKLKKILDKQFYNDNINIIGYCNNMADVYNNSDLVVSKAGGLTVAETINSGVPLLLNSTRSLKGQETSNIKFVQENKIGLVAEEEKLLENILKLIDDTKLYKEMVHNIEEIFIDNQKEIIEKFLKDNLK